MDPKKESKKPHAVFIPYPLQGHITPMMKLAQLFHQKGFYITIINTEFIQNSLFKHGHPNFLPDDFNFETYPDGLPASDAATQDIYSLCESSRYKFSDPIREVVLKIGSCDHTVIPGVSCVISDPLMPYVVDIAKEMGVLSFLFWTASACSFMVYQQYLQINERGPLPATDGTADNIIDWVPGLKNARLRDLSFVDKSQYDFPMKEIAQSFKATPTGVIINTFDSLEHDVLSATSSMFSQVYPIGPLQMLPISNPNDTLKPISFNFWEQQPQCLEWLNSMEPNSVLYISFGSLIFLTMEELIEFAWGVINSNHPFLWIIRKNMVNNEPTMLPPDLQNRVQEVGFITNWCPQEEVINHPAIGGFISHCGWNSTLDSICAGVPIICWPRIGDQLINCRYSCMNWGIGMEINQVVKRDEVEKAVRDLMEGEHGRKLKKKVEEWKNLASICTSQGGSSSLNVDKLLKAASKCYP